MKAYKETVRKYYKYVAWTQPVLTGYTTSTGLGNITVSATSDYGGNCQAWKIMIGSVSSTVDNNYWQLANSNNQESLTLKFPYKLKISNLKITTRPRDNYTRSIGIFNSEGTQIGSTVNCNAPLTEYTVLSNGSAVTDTLTIIVFAGSNNSYFGLQNLQIIAQRITEGTSSDYDFYEDVFTYKIVKDTIRKYYKRTTFTADGTYTVPSGITKLKIDCVGAKGYTAVSGSWVGNGGNGGRVECDLAVSAGQVLNVTVGAVPTTTSQTYNASDIRIGGNTLNDRVIVAGGGGSGVYKQDPRGITHGVADGGAGGGLVGGNGGNAGADRTGQGGTQSGGGLGAYSSYPYHPFTAGNGEFGLGGTGNQNQGGIAGAGGAGWYGGGGAGCNGVFISAGYSSNGAGAGGGSSYTNSSCTNVVHTQGYQNGDGYINIDYPSTSSDYDYYVDENICKAFNI